MPKWNKIIDNLSTYNNVGGETHRTLKNVSLIAVEPETNTNEETKLLRGFHQNKWRLLKRIRSTPYIPTNKILFKGLIELNMLLMYLKIGCLSRIQHNQEKL